MGQINIEGLGIVEIAGDDPTREELQIIESFISEQGLEGTTPEEQDSNAFAEWFKENLDLPGGIAGAYTGFKTVAKYSPIKHPLLLGTGAVVGGFLGTFFGSANSSKYKTGEADYNKALKDASVSAGIDIATLGAFKYLSPVYKALKTKRKTYVGAAGTDESLQATQKLLEEGGGTLLPSQVVRQDNLFKGWYDVSESISAVGLLSRGKLDKIAQNNSEVIQREVKKQIDGINPEFALSTEKLGEEMFGIIQQAKKVNQTSYTNGLSRLSEKYGNTNVPVGNITKAIDDFVAEANKDGINTLSKQTLKVIQKTKENLIGNQLASSKVAFNALPDASVNKLMAFQKEINKDVSNAGSYKSGFSDSDTADLSKFSKVISKSVDNTLNIANKGLAKEYRAITKSYGETLGNLLPEINKSIAKTGKNEDYYAIGRLITNNTNPSKIRKLMSSLDSSFKIAKKEGITLEAAVKSADEAKQMIRQTYIKNIFGETSGTFDVKKFQTKLQKIDTNPQEAERLKVLLGKDGYNNFKKTANALLESSKKPGQDMFSLAIRSREVSAGTSVIAGAEAAKGAFYSATSILAIPWVLSKIVVNKKAANKLLTLNNRVRQNSLGVGEALTADYAGKAVASIINELPDYDKEDIKFKMGTKEE